MAGTKTDEFDKYVYDQEYRKKNFFNINVLIPKWQKFIFSNNGLLSKKLNAMGKSKLKWIREILTTEAAKVLGVNSLEELLLDEDLLDMALKECGAASLEDALPPKSKDAIMQFLEEKKKKI